MVHSTISCLKELKEDSKISAWFKELMGEDLEIQKVIKNASSGQYIALSSRVMKVSEGSAN